MTKNLFVSYGTLSFETPCGIDNGNSFLGKIEGGSSDAIALNKSPEYAPLAAALTFLAELDEADEADEADEGDPEEDNAEEDNPEDDALATSEADDTALLNRFE